MNQTISIQLIVGNKENSLLTVSREHAAQKSMLCKQDVTDSGPACLCMSIQNTGMPIKLIKFPTKLY